jgi:murein DD-endopeptidase MepM/ murein hydrolase activator NlpD
MISKYSIGLIITILFLSNPTPVLSQTEIPPSGPVYIISQGDSLSGIAEKFRIDIQDIINVNGIIDPNQLFPGDQLVIPGLEGIQGILTTRIVSFGDSQRSLSRQYRNPSQQLQELNHIISPTEFYAGVDLIMLQDPGTPAWSGSTSLVTGETLLELAIRQNTDPWTLSEINFLAGNWAGLPGDILYYPGTASGKTLTGLPPVFNSIQVTPLPIVQGSTTQVQVSTTSEVYLGGNLINNDLHFFQLKNGMWVSLQGVHALTEPGLYPLRLDATLPDGKIQSYEQWVLVQTGYYPSEELYVDPKSIDPAITKPEEDFIRSIVKEATPERFWEGYFMNPASLYESTSFLTSKFGNRRTYHGIGTDLEIHGFHSGLDFGGGTGLPISAPAPGKVVFAGPLEIRGNATIIDHGWGVFSGFWHQSDLKVQAGDFVETGQVIGLVGSTGRATGAHLHWEIWVNGVQVDPMDWLENIYPTP